MKDAYYFSHDSNAKDDPKCVLLIEQLGMEGYGIFWMLIETLRDQPNYKYPLILVPALARRYNTTAEKVKTVVGGYGLFVTDENEFFSLSLMQRMETFEHKREMARIAGKKSAEKRLGLNSGSTDVQQTLNDGSTYLQPNKGKERKVNQSKIKTYTDNPELLETIEEFIVMRNKIKEPMTDRAITIMLNKLSDLSKTDNGKIEILNQSIMNNWKGVYELKQPSTGNFYQQKAVGSGFKILGGG